MLLKPLVTLMAVAAVAFLVRDLLIGAADLGWIPFAAVLFLIGLAALLYGSRTLGLAALRRIELAAFASVTLHLLVGHAGLIRAAAAEGDAGLMLAAWNMSVLSFVLLITAYAVFVPNTWQRAALLVLPLALAPLGLGAWLRASDARVAALSAAVLDTRAFTDAVLVLAVATAVALLGAGLIARFRTLTFEAREANLYDLEAKIGEGGMGEVWRARHHMLARPAAIKIIKPELVGNGDRSAAKVALSRFRREAQATAALRSPHTVEIYDFGITRDGNFFYAMEFLDGIDLQSLVHRYGPLPASRVVYLLRQACRSLADAHAHGLIHRDVKPANLFACRLGQEHDFVKVLDFGLVKDQRPTAQTQLTAEGLTTGTPAFMAPEMAVNDHPVGPQTDVYALGCVAYWLLTGKLVFEGATPLAIVVEHVRSPPVPPSQRTEIEVPAELDAIILRCLAKRPADRYASALELAAALGDVPLQVPWDEGRAAAWWNLHEPIARAS